MEDDNSTSELQTQLTHNAVLYTWLTTILHLTRQNFPKPHETDLQTRSTLHPGLDAIQDIAESIDAYHTLLNEADERGVDTEESRNLELTLPLHRLAGLVLNLFPKCESDHGMTASCGISFVREEYMCNHEALGKPLWIHKVGDMEIEVDILEVWECSRWVWLEAVVETKREIEEVLRGSEADLEDYGEMVENGEFGSCMECQERVDEEL